MNEFQASLIIQWYEDLEERLLEFLRFIPLIPQNFDVFSPRLATILTEAGDILDSLFREVSPPTVTIDGTPKKKKELKIGDYAKLYADKLVLPTTRSLVFVSPPVYLVPFQDWDASVSPGKNYPTPCWWTVYNKQKHSRLQDVDKATLIVALKALCGLHHVITKLPELKQAILRHGWLQIGGWNPEIALETLKDPQRHASAPAGTPTYIAESKLFAVPLGPCNFPDYIADLQPTYYVCSQRMIRFFGRWY